MMIYRPFELHNHTIHSDGSFTPEELLKASADWGLDGIALTDHNTDSGVAEMTPELQKKYLPVIPGIEWTTFYGHMLVLGADHFVDWRFAVPDTIDRATDEVVRADGVIGIAHPFSMGGALYTGGFWEFNVKNWSNISYIEVFHKGENDDRKENARALAWWTSLLDNGCHLAITAGRDYHRPDKTPTLAAVTYLGLTDGKITTDAVKKALRNGRTYVTLGPALSVEVHTTGISAGISFSECCGIGGKLRAGHGTVTVGVDEKARRKFVRPWQIKPKTVILTANGAPIAEAAYEKETVSLEADLPRGWIRVELYGTWKDCPKEKELLAMTSPIYIN